MFLHGMLVVWKKVFAGLDAEPLQVLPRAGVTS